MHTFLDDCVGIFSLINMCWIEWCQLCRYRTGQQESVILRKLSGADPESRRHCVRLFSSFEYRNHLCLVFESLHMNLREVLKKFGRNIGISLTAVRAYAKQLFIALKHLRNCGVLHCDIKPDNMLVSATLYLHLMAARFKDVQVSLRLGSWCQVCHQ